MDRAFAQGLAQCQEVFLKVRAVLQQLRLLALCTGCVHAALIASSSLESCVDDGSHQPLECAQKMVVALSVENGQDGTEAVHATLRDVIDRTGTLGAVDVPRELEEPMAISLSKSKVLQVTPSRSIQATNALQI